LWAFKISKALDADGKEIPVDIFSFTNSINTRPTPFPCRFEVRSDKVRATIVREAAEALDELSVYEGKTDYQKTDYRKTIKVPS